MDLCRGTGDALQWEYKVSGLRSQVRGLDLEDRALCYLKGEI